MKHCLLLSGGMDSIALAYWLRPEYALTVDYGQLPADAEIAASCEVCSALAIEHVIIKCDCSSIGLGTMLNTAPNGDAKSPLISTPSPEWWPFRNQLIVTLAASKAVQIGVDRLLIGTVASDAKHRDGTTEFIKHLSQLLVLQEGEVRLDAPAINLTSIELVQASKVPKSILLWAHSCHTSNIPCSVCRGCLKYREIVKGIQALNGSR
jgi:7-cyano-7-deazaguanine synthase